MLTRLAQRITDHPRRFVAAAAVFFVVAVVVGTPVTGLLSAGNADDFVDPSAESTRHVGRISSSASGGR